MPWSWGRALAFLFLPVTAAAQSSPIADQYIHRAWGTADGLPQNSITTMVQTRDGYLWLGTFGGLVRFDGNAFTVFDPGNTPGLISGRITALLEAKDGSLWVATESGLARFQDGRFTSHTGEGMLPPGGIVTMFEDRQRRLWVSLGSTLARFDGRTFVTFAGVAAPPAKTGDVRVASFAETPDGRLWVGTHSGVGRIEGDHTVSVTMEAGGPRTVVTSLLVDSKGRLWAAAGSLWRLDPDMEYPHFNEIPLTSKAGESANIGVFAEDRDGSLWLGSGRSGLYRWRDGVVDVYDTADGLTDNNARATLVDREGNVWIGTDVAGLNRLRRRHVWSYEVPDRQQPSIAPIVGDGAGGLWIGGTCSGLLHFYGGGFRDVETKAHGLPNDCIWALHRDADGTLWMGSPGTGLARRQDGRVRAFTTSDGLASNDVFGIARDRDGALWVGTTAGVSRFQDGRFVNFGPAQGLHHDVRCIYQTRDGAVWLGGVDGLSRYQDGRFKRFAAADGLSHPHVRAIYEDADGTIWIGTYGGGLNRYRGGRFTTYLMKNGLHDNAVSRIIEDDRGNLWMSGNNGVFRVARSQLNAFAEGRTSYVTSVSYGTADGMAIDETNGGQPAGWRTADGRLWFPTIKGLVSIEPPTAAPPSPAVLVERVAVDGEVMTDARLGSLGPGDADVEIHYTAIDLGAAEKTRFRYRLIGYDRTWIDSGSRRVAYYTRIPPGSYQFEVLATNSDGEWHTTPGRIALSVRPLFWQRRAVQAGAGILLLAATAFAVRSISLRRARSRLAELERDRALERERSRIARDLHDDLGSRLTLIAMMADPSAGTAGGRIADAALDAARAMDELVWTVNARNDTVEGFAYYLAQFAEEQIVAAGIRCRMMLPEALPDRPLSAEVRRHLYLACKEAVNNAVKHAGAGEIRVSLSVLDHRLQVEIADDGRGLPADVDRTGNGLRNYRERMAAVGGTATVESAPAAGTTVTFETPL
jgi:ligand-binding sensor domain-containing protein/signal transduction histidine kinase